MQTQTSLSSQLTARERGITTALLGLGLITFAIDASNTTLILPRRSPRPFSTKFSPPASVAWR
jgi:hypothetical protein